LLMTASRESSAVYAAADGRELPMLVFEPAESAQPAAGIVMFHGGGLRGGAADELAPHCRRLASSGILAVSAGYRLIGQEAASIYDCLADVRQAVEQFARLAALRGIDAAQLASGGSSAGAHLALVAAMTSPGLPLPAAAPGVAAVMALNPVVDLLAYAPAEQRLLEQRAG